MVFCQSWFAAINRLTVLSLSSHGNLKKIFFIDVRETESDRDINVFVVPLIYALIG